MRSRRYELQRPANQTTGTVSVAGKTKCRGAGHLPCDARLLFTEGKADIEQSHVRCTLVEVKHGTPADAPQKMAGDAFSDHIHDASPQLPLVQPVAATSSSFGRCLRFPWSQSRTTMQVGSPWSHRSRSHPRGIDSTLSSLTPRRFAERMAMRTTAATWRACSSGVRGGSPEEQASACPWETPWLAEGAGAAERTVGWSWTRLRSAFARIGLWSVGKAMMVAVLVVMARVSLGRALGSTFLGFELDGMRCCGRLRAASVGRQTGPAQSQR